MKANLFGNNIEPACTYCEHGKLVREGKSVMCKKKGVVDPNYSCKSFDYAPLKRVPKKAAPLPDYTKDDFAL